MIRGLCRVCRQAVSDRQQAVFAITAFQVERGQLLHRRRRDNWICHKHCFDVEILKHTGTGEQLEMTS